ncbi:MAG: hypothetical protein IT369_10145 [Candidatus Latescibacteria bacterium]|nr:hypothetical protein [Candidatus Latescibacterota bacterium]
MTEVSRLGGGYAESRPDPGPTVEALLRVVRPGAAGACLGIIAGPPGVGKSALAARLLTLAPRSFWIDKDFTAAGFVLAAARQAGQPETSAYGTPAYWENLRPLEYAGPLSLACANLVGDRLVLLSGGWGPELAVPALWEGLREGLAPARLRVLHLDAPPLEVWRARMAGRGSRSDSPWFEHFAATLTRLPVWQGAMRLGTDRPIDAVAAEAWRALT